PPNVQGTQPAFQNGTWFADSIRASSPKAAASTGRRQDCFRPTPQHQIDTCNAGAIQTRHSAESPCPTPLRSFELIAGQKGEARCCGLGGKQIRSLGGSAS